MKLFIFSILTFILFNSCKKEVKNIEYNSRYEKETYEMINQAYLPILEKIGKRNSKFDKQAKQIFEIPYSFVLSDKIKHKNLLSEEYLFKMDTTLTINKWDNKYLNNVRLIERHTYNEFSNLYEKEKFNLENFIRAWEKEIGSVYVVISNPIFNKNYDRAILYFYYKDYDWRCGFGKSGLFEFSKNDEKWKYKRDIYDIEN